MIATGWEDCQPLGNPKLWQQFALQNPVKRLKTGDKSNKETIAALRKAYRKKLRDLFSKFGYPETPHPDTTRPMGPKSIARFTDEMHLLWIATRLVETLDSISDADDFDTEVKRILMLEKAWNDRTLTLFKEQVLLVGLRGKGRPEEYGSSWIEEDYDPETVDSDLYEIALDSEGNTDLHFVFVEPSEVETEDLKGVRIHTNPEKPSARFTTADFEAGLRAMVWTPDVVVMVLNALIKSKIGEVRIEPDLQARTIRIVPPTLLSGLWFQFSQQAVSSLHLRTCPRCGKLLVRATKRKEYCGAKCRVYAKRDRQSVTTVSQRQPKKAVKGRKSP